MRHLLVFTAIIAAAALSCGDSSIKVAPPLFVSDTMPANGATVSAASLNVLAVSFSEAIDEGSLKDKVALAAVSSWTDTGGGTAVAIALVSLNKDDGMTAVYSIAAPLTAGTYYRLTISKDGVASASGNQMAADVSHYFLAQ